MQRLAFDEPVRGVFWDVGIIQGKDAAARPLKNRVHLTTLGSSVSLIFGISSRATEERAQNYLVGRSNRQAADDCILSRQEQHGYIPLKTCSRRRPPPPPGRSCMGANWWGARILQRQHPLDVQKTSHVGTAVGGLTDVVETAPSEQNSSYILGGRWEEQVLPLEFLCTSNSEG